MQFASIPEDLSEHRRKMIARRVYIARYAPGLSQARLDEMTSGEIAIYHREISNLIGRENGDGDETKRKQPTEWL